MRSLIYQFKHLTRVQTKSDFTLFVVVICLFMVVLYIQRCPSFEARKEAIIYGKTLKEKLINIFLDFSLSNLLSIVFFIVLS